ncbi:GIY-YIG nuclease family protein [Streptomyces sp. NBC_00124]|uniref:GIY-YIG nuclease family protein n=1 Tax=Streptomyces sp. NBC_00124 TaxID=2975662 RepID=UPI00224D44B0|nr:GIY-YIG nuclease family protein [Streptomyces sp. NBC_00124]MCX5365906.1 GIY-YIG nuclease family protein [Streptomyces sp. NBC_00124]
MPESESVEVVYVLGTPGSNTVKIGRTTNLKKRLADIQRMSPVPLFVLWTSPGGSDLETNLHRHFKSIRSHGEWFTFKGDPVSLIQAAVAAAPWSIQIRQPRKVARVPKKRTVVDLRPVSAMQRTRQLEKVDLAFARVLAGLESIPSPEARYRALLDVESSLKSELRQVQQQSVLNIKSSGRTWREVGSLLGVSGARAEQISRLSR